ncbi:hypothetical protein J6590_012235 [Homalodisca vitripennis]|nr:hypothetical protein J6590_012235 [Homalodisca vitripennis]
MVGGLGGQGGVVTAITKRVDLRWPAPIRESTYCDCYSFLCCLSAIGRTVNKVERAFLHPLAACTPLNNARQINITGASGNAARGHIQVATRRGVRGDPIYADAGNNVDVDPTVRSTSGCFTLGELKSGEDGLALLKGGYL